MIEVIQQNYPRTKDPRIIAAKYAEIQNLVKCERLCIVMHHGLLDGAYALTARVFLEIKSNEDKIERFKARYVPGGHLDVLKDFLFHRAQALLSASVGLAWLV